MVKTPQSLIVKLETTLTPKYLPLTKKAGKISAEQRSKSSSRNSEFKYTSRSSKIIKF